MSDVYRLEYSEKFGCFHLNDPDKTYDNTHSYFCICNRMTGTQCDEFTLLMASKYPNINTLNDKYYPSINTIKQEFEDFLLS